MSVRFVEILKTMDEKQIDEFVLLVQSPFFNTKKHINVLVAHLQKIYPLFHEDKLNPTFLFSIMFPDESYKEDKLKRQLLAVSQLLENYIVISNTLKPSPAYHLMLSKYFIKNKQNYFFESHIKEASNLLNKETLLDETHYYNHFQIAELLYEYNSYSDKGKGSLNLEELSVAFDKYSILKKLELYTLIHTRAINYKVEYNDKLENLLIENVVANAFYNSSAIEITYYMYLCAVRKIDELEYEKYKSLVFKHGNSLPKEELINSLTALSNASAFVFSDKNIHFANLFSIIQYQIDNSLLMYNEKYILPSIFDKAVSVGIYTNQLTWSASFIKKYAAYLPELHHDNYVNYAKAKLHFAKSEYSNAYDLLINISFTDTILKLGVRSMILKCNYEMNDYDLLDFNLNAFKVYLYRDKELGDYIKTPYNNFSNLLIRLLKIKHTQDKKNIKKIQVAIEKETNVAEKNWLISKANEL